MRGRSVVFSAGLALTLAACSVAPYVVLTNETAKTIIVHEPKYIGAEKTHKHRIGPGDSQRLGLLLVSPSLRINIGRCDVRYKLPEIRQHSWSNPPRVDARLLEDLTITAIPPYAEIDRKMPKAALYEKHGVVLHPISKVCDQSR